MRVGVAFGGWWLVLTAAWWAAALPGQALDGAQGVALWWQLRQQALYLSGVWSIGMMSLVMLLALRHPWMERPLGGMDQVYRLHKWLGMGAAVAAVLHWAVKESSGWIKDVWGTAGRPARDVVLPWALEWRSAAPPKMWGNGRFMPCWCWSFSRCGNACCLTAPGAKCTA